VLSFVTPKGEQRHLKNPYAPATPRQLRYLNELGCLEAVEPGRKPSLTVGEAAWLIDTFGTAAP
jgi:hypothetical protein